MQKITLFFSLITLYFSANTYASTYPLTCELRDKGTKQVLSIITNMDGVFGDEGGLRKTVEINGNSVKGYLYTTDGQDENGHGLKYVVVNFGDNLTLRSTLSPANYDDENQNIVARGSATLYQFDQLYLGSGNCTVHSNCDGDPRVCADELTHHALRL